MGLLTRSKNTKVVNPFRKGEMIIENARKMSKSFTTTHSYEAFWNFTNTPAMASCSFAEIGALMAESFCERVLSAGNLVVNEGNTLLANEEVEMLTILRINR